MLKGISRRWFVNTVGLILVILIVFIVVLSFTVQSYTYSNISNTLAGRMEGLVNVLKSDNMTTTEFVASTRAQVETYADKNSMELMAIDKNGRIIATSTGFEPNASQEMKDYNDALRSADNTGSWQGKLDTGEKAMALTHVVRDLNDNDKIICSIRFIVSLEKADQQITLIVFALIIIGFLIMLFIFVSGLYFIRSIVLPIRQVTVSARQIARGDFDVRIEKKKEDEIGQLCDSINDMASELSAADRMKNDFISSISHELRTPLTSIKGWAETLRAGVDDDTEERGMKVIIRESERLSGLVEELLDFSRLQNDAMKLIMQKVDILAELDSAVFMFTDRADTEKKALHYEENISLSPICGDVDRLRQVFVNIIDNALKYTGAGGTIRISSSESGGYVHIRVQDTGCGIPAEHLQNVKKKFYKANQLVRGSGIGLALADEIVAMHCGTLEIDSVENEGTSVTVSLPTIALLKNQPELAVSAELKQAMETLTA